MKRGGGRKAVQRKGGGGRRQGARGCLMMRFLSPHTSSTRFTVGQNLYDRRLPATTGECPSEREGLKEKESRLMSARECKAPARQEAAR
jgi:hypothetical protein